MSTHICKRCNIEKPLNQENFKLEKRVKSGFDVTCRECRKLQQTQHRKNNIEFYKAKEAKIRKSSKYIEYHNKYYIENSDALKNNARLKYDENPEPFLRRSKEQKKRLGQKYKDYLREYGKLNRKKLTEYQKKRLKTDVHFKIKHLVGCCIRKMLKGRLKLSRTLTYLGCTPEFFKGYIAAKFRDGMSWENHGTVWHLDHILPCRSFDLTVEEEIYKCFNYTNYQPLLVHENLTKQDTLPNGALARHIYPKDGGSDS